MVYLIQGTMTPFIKEKEITCPLWWTLGMYDYLFLKLKLKIQFPSPMANGYPAG